jgi:hypothetical protein
MFDPNYSMTMSGMMSSSQASSSYEGGNDGSVETATTNTTGNNSLDQRQRQQLATLDGNNNNDNSRHPSSSHRGGGGSSTNTTGSTRSRSLNLDSSDYIDDKADEREIRNQLAKHGQAVGAYAMEEEAPNRQELRGRVNRMSRSESQRRARLAELSRGSGGNGGGGVAIPEGDDLIDANIERMEDFEYRNLSLYEKGFGKIGLGGTERKMERCICILFTICCVVLIVAISLFLTLP